MPKQRADGEGGVWQEKSGRWRGAISQTNAAGKRRRIERYGKTRKEVADKLALARRSLDGGSTLTKQPIVSMFLDDWMEQIVKEEDKPTTIHRYSQTIRLDIVPHLGTCRLDKLVTKQLQAWINTLKREKTIHAAEQGYKVLHAALNVAVRWNLIQRNPLSAVKKPHAVAKPIMPLTREQAATLLEAAKGHRLEALYSVALALGLRRGEIVALRWDDIDWQKRTLRIDSTFSRANQTLNETRTKTDDVSIVPLPPELIRALRAHQQYQREERILKADKWQDRNLIFASEVGTPIEPRNLNRSFKALLKRAGLPSTTRFHDLRHSCATLLIAQGVHIKIVQSVLRHRRLELTADLYGHVYDEMQRDAVGDMFEGIKKKEAS